MSTPSPIHWPDHYRNCPVQVQNELDMEAPQDRVWAWLVRAPLWPWWYENSKNVRILNGSGPDLQWGTQFVWKTFSVTITSTVLEYVPNERIAWDAHGVGVDAYHAWLLSPSAKGCHVLTEEAQHGWGARLQKVLRPNRMRTYHQIWLESLEGKALSGFPPEAARTGNASFIARL
jgi:hypothetical protein